MPENSCFWASEIDTVSGCLINYLQAVESQGFWAGKTDETVIPSCVKLTRLGHAT